MWTDSAASVANKKPVVASKQASKTGHTVNKRQTCAKDRVQRPACCTTLYGSKVTQQTSSNSFISSCSIAETIVCQATPAEASLPTLMVAPPAEQSCRQQPCKASKQELTVPC